MAEARILVRPDTTAFRGLLEAELRASLAKPIAVPVVPVMAGPTGAFAASQATAAAQTQAVAAALETEAIAANQATASVQRLTAAQTGHAAALGRVRQGAASSALSLFGIRGATLAASGGFLAGAAAVTLFAKSLQSAASLETELNVFNVTAGATADEMERVAAAAKQLGRDITLPGVTAGEAATAMTELAKAGLSVQDSLAGARGALQLSTAAQIDVKDATNLVAGALNAFQLSGNDAVRVADLLTGAAKESQGEITDMGTALGQVASVSQQFGVSISDTVTLLTELAQAGLSGGRAGTSLRVAFLRLVNPTEAAAKALDNLNVAVRDANGNLRPGVFTDISEALDGYSKAQRDATLATIFGSDAIRAAAIIGNKGTLAFLKTSAAVTEMGLAQQQAAARTSGLQGDFENLSNQVSALGLTIGEAAKGPASLFVKQLASIASDANVAATGVVNLAGAVKDLGEDFGRTVPYGDKLADGFVRIAKVATKLNPSFFGIPVLADGLKKVGVSTEEATKKTDAYGNAIDGVTESVSALSAALLQSAADSKINTQAISSATAALLQSAADSRIDFSKLGQADTSRTKRLGAEQIQNIIVGFDAQEVRAKIAGDNAKLLDVLATEQDFLERQLARDYVQRRPALRRTIEAALLGAVNEIEAIQGKATSEAARIRRDAEKAANDAAAAVRAREQALLAQFGVARDQQANKIAAAAQTDGLQDDLKRQQELKQIVLKQIAAVKEQVSIEGGKVAALTALRAILIQVKAATDAVKEQQRKNQEAQRQALLAAIGLDIELAEITGNQAAEVAARNRKIAVLNKALEAERKAHGKSTVAYKEIRNEIARQNAAKKEIVAERTKGQSFAQASFEFLQSQQGFASNLLGNLIPQGATAGLVGGGGAVQGALNPQAAFSDGQGRSTPTSGQVQTTNAVLLRILDQMKILNGSRAAPEAWNQYAAQNAVQDGVGGG